MALRVCAAKSGARILLWTGQARGVFERQRRPAKLAPPRPAVLAPRGRRAHVARLQSREICVAFTADVVLVPLGEQREVSQRNPQVRGCGPQLGC